MQNFMIKLRNFMEGRNGPDKLTFVLLLVYSLLSFVKTPFRNIIAVYIIVSVLQFAVLIFGLYRVFSKNLQKRYRENFKFEQLLSRYNPMIERKNFVFIISEHIVSEHVKAAESFSDSKRATVRKRLFAPNAAKNLHFTFCSEQTPGIFFIIGKSCYTQLFFCFRVNKFSFV